ncbi:MAG: hypothetical protein JJ858_19230, partial [Rhizobiaceae bacterium]|nr:hypothetical protein [Rhizobiaceae bacterium]
GIHHGQINESLFESIKWLRKAAEQDDQYGLMHLSVIMASGNEAIVVDVEEALRLVDRSIQLGNKMAIYAKLQLYGFAVLDAEADSIRQKLTNESMESKIRAAFLESYLFNQNFDSLKRALELTPLHDNEEIELQYTKSTYWDTDSQFLSTLKWISEDLSYPAPHRQYLHKYLSKH